MVKTVSLSNNITIVYEEMPSIMSIACGVFVKNGSRMENAQNNGISHFIEHMLFKGTKNRTARQIADEVDAIGGQMNAFTSKEYTGYYIRTLFNHMDKSLEILSDMFLNSNFDNEEIKKECGVILEEIDMYEDSPEDLIHDLLQNKIFDDSLGYSVIGRKDSISTFNHDTFVDFFEKNYHQDNIYISIVGKFEESVLLDVLEKYFGSLNRNDAYKEFQFSSKYHKSFVTKVKDIEQVHFMLAFPGFPLDSEFNYDIAALNSIFGGSMSSRLFQTIREENGLSYAVYSYMSSYIDTGAFCLYAGLNPNQTNLCYELMIKEVKRLFTDKITIEQLDRTKEQLKSNYFLGMESSMTRMLSIGKTKTVLNKVQSQEEILKKIDRISLDRIYEVAERIFDLNNMSLAAVGKITDIDFEGMYNNAK